MLLQEVMAPPALSMPQVRLYALVYMIATWLVSYCILTCSIISLLCATLWAFCCSSLNVK